MSNTSRGRESGAGSRTPPARRRLFFCLLTSVSCLLSFGCRMDMQDQPRYEPYEPGDRKYFRDGKASRQLVEGTVPRVGPGQPYVDVQNDYLYTGRSAVTGSSLQQGAQRNPGGAGADTGGMGAGGAQGMTGGGAQGVRANVPTTGGGAATAAGAQGGPDVFPLTIDGAALERGQERYNIYCAMCHGGTGEGDGMIWRRGFRKPPSFYEDRLQEPVSSAAHLFDVVTNGWGAMPSYSDMIPPEDRWKIIAYVRAMQLSRKLKAGELSEADRQKVERGERVGPGGRRGAAAGEGGEGQPGQGDKNH